MGSQASFFSYFTLRKYTLKKYAFGKNASEKYAVGKTGLKNTNKLLAPLSEIILYCPVLLLLLPIKV